MSRRHRPGRPHRSRIDASRKRTPLIHGAGDRQQWDCPSHLVPPMAASVASRLGMVHRYAQSVARCRVHASGDRRCRRSLSHSTARGHDAPRRACQHGPDWRRSAPHAARIAPRRYKQAPRLGARHATLAVSGPAAPYWGDPAVGGGHRLGGAHRHRPRHSWGFSAALVTWCGWHSATPASPGPGPRASVRRSPYPAARGSVPGHGACRLRQPGDK